MASIALTHVQPSKPGTAETVLDALCKIHAYCSGLFFFFFPSLSFRGSQVPRILKSLGFQAEKKISLSC